MASFSYPCIIYRRKFQLNGLLTNEIMPCQSGKIECMRKTPFCKYSLSYLASYVSVVSYILAIYIIREVKTESVAGRVILAYSVATVF